MNKGISADQALDKFIPLCIKNKQLDVLDVGAGKMAHTTRMKDAGLNPKSTDFFPQCDYPGDYNKLDFGKQFDAIWCAHVLEHQLNVNQFLTKIHRDVKEGGFVAITVPPLKQRLVGGHVSLWNAGLLLYNMVLAGFNCSKAMIKAYDYNISVIVRKDSFVMPELTFDTADTIILEPYFPAALYKNDAKNERLKQMGIKKRGFQGNIEELNW